MQGEIDAAERLAALRANSRSERDERLVSLADGVAAIDRSIAERLNRVALAELALEQGNIGHSYPHFVGRHRELTLLQDQLTAKRRVGVISPLSGLSGQGKVALAQQNPTPTPSTTRSAGAGSPPARDRPTSRQCSSRWCAVSIQHQLGA